MNWLLFYQTLFLAVGIFVIGALIIYTIRNIIALIQRKMIIAYLDKIYQTFDQGKEESNGENKWIETACKVLYRECQHLYVERIAKDTYLQKKYFSPEELLKRYLLDALSLNDNIELKRYAFDNILLKPDVDGVHSLAYKSWIETAVGIICIVASTVGVVISILSWVLT